MDNAEGLITRRSSSLRVFFIILILLLSSMAFGRPFDWYYSRLGTPFAVFYNPSLIGNNPGYTFGLDAMHVDSSNYDVRGVIVLPVSRIMTHEDHLRYGGEGKRFRYSNNSYRSSSAAVSVGGIYSGEDYYQLSAGFVVPVWFIGSGVSIDVSYMDGDPFTSVNAAFNACLPRTGEGIFRLGFHNIVTGGDREDSNDFGISIGTGGTPFAGSRIFNLPYDIGVKFHIRDGNVKKTEGTARITFDLSHIYTSEETFGQSITGAIGYNLSRLRYGKSEHSFFASFGIVFINKSSSAAVMGSYGAGDEKHGTVFYSAYKRNSLGGMILGSAIGDDAAYAGLRFVDAGDGKYVFDLKFDGAEAQSWVLRIDNSRGESVRTFSGGNIVPSSVLWDGLKADESKVTDDIVFAKLVIRTETRVIESETVGIEFGDF